MTGHVSQPSREEVLGAFAVEPDHGRDTLERYLQAYPAFAADLLDLLHELSRPVPQQAAPPSPADAARIDAAWLRHHGVRPNVAAGDRPTARDDDPVVDPLAVLSIEDLRNAARTLGVPRQVLTAFRERRVDLATVPRAFLVRLARATHSSLEALSTALAQPAPLAPARHYKSDTKPSSDAPVAFERVLREAGVPDADVVALLTDDGDPPP